MRCRQRVPGSLPLADRQVSRVTEPGRDTIDRTNVREMVDLTGIEPVTSSMPLMRAPNCATGPLWRGLEQTNPNGNAPGWQGQTSHGNGFTLGDQKGNGDL